MEKTYKKTTVVEIALSEIPKALINDLKKGEGLPPYDGPSNICRGDGYFYKSIERKYSADEIAAAYELVIKPMREALEKAKAEVMAKFR